MVVSLGAGYLPDLMASLTATDPTLPEPYRYALYLGAMLSILSALPLLGVASGVRKAPTSEDTFDDAPFPKRVFVAFSAISV